MTPREPGVPTNPETYAERLRWAMDRGGYGGIGGQTALAKAIGVSSQSINQVVAGGAKSLSTMAHCRASQLLQVNPLWLADGAGVPEDVSAFGIEATSTRSVQVTEEEARMVNQLRGLPPALQASLRALVTTAAATLRPLESVA
jgi:hypothetical protein